MTSFETISSALVERQAPTTVASYPGSYISHAPDSNSAQYGGGNGEYSAAIRDMIQRGQVPLLNNGWAFAMDEQPVGRESEPIPATVFTRRYFRHGLIPIAAPNHSLHDHDLDHVPVYQWIFSVPRFALLARTAATNASSAETLCREFTGAIDNFGDCLRSIQSDRASSGSIFMGDLRGARNDLARLVALEARSIGPKSTQEEGLVDKLWDALGLAVYEDEIIDLIPGLRYNPEDRSDTVEPDILATRSRQKKSTLVSKVSPALQGLTRLLF